ncbi:Uncharacterised protein [Gordonia bronchialis]|nr:Uncharacterised protein [Gordonia bronchialis]
MRPFCRHDLRDATVIEANDDLCTAQRYLTALAEATDIDDPTSRYDRTAATTRFEAFCDLAADKVGIEASSPSAPIRSVSKSDEHRTVHPVRG